jgi:hypothetical protein
VSGPADLWPLGAGALVNQQTTHRGEAHTGGPERVVLILTFAPRPRWSSRSAVVETRVIGTSGSYSLHHTQWGHTLRDFQDPTLRMRQPWRTLRSLGLYKPPGAASGWGWDYITVACSRIGNHDTGFAREDLDWEIEKFATKHVSWFPMSLLDTEYQEIEGSMAWVVFARGTLRNIATAMTKLHIAVVCVCCAAYLVHSILLRKKVPFVKTFGKHISRMALFHSAIAFLFLYWLGPSIENSTWARNIRHGRTFSLSPDLAGTPLLPATLPNEDDVLIFEGMQSEFMASFTSTLEVFHPGNKEWRHHVSRYSLGYHTVSSNLQTQLRQSLLRDTEHEGRRILIKNREGNWARVTPQLGQWFSHKCLLTGSNRYILEAVRWLDFLISDARYGYWRDTAMHKRHIIRLLTNLQDRILGIPRSLSGKVQQIGLPAFRYSTFRWNHWRLPSLPNLKPLHRRGRPSLPINRFIPRDSIQEGDVVDANYGSTSGGTKLLQLHAAITIWSQI